MKKRKVLMDLVMVGIIFLMALLFMMTGCKHEPGDLPFPVPEGSNPSNPPANPPGQEPEPVSNCDPDSVYFENDILPLLVSNCAKSGCHNAEDHKEGVVLINYQTIMSTGDVEPGDPGHSEIFEMITENDNDDRMPPAPNPRMSPSDIDKIYRWISQGAQNNSCNPGCNTSDVRFSNVIQPMLQLNCVGCHNQTLMNGQVDLSTYQGVRTVALNGRLESAVNHEPGFVPMPQGAAKLSACKLEQISIWIGNGANND